MTNQPPEPTVTAGAPRDNYDEGRSSRRIGPYKLLQKLGEGGMGEVWMADQEQPIRRRVALKLIKSGLDNRQIIARFEAERQALAMMDHQNIAKVLDAGTTDDGAPYFVMELVQGIPITKYCDQNRLSINERLELFLPVCQAVQHAHQKGIIHRDLKPSNVLVCQYDGKPLPKVIDFGLAKALQHQSRLTDKTMFTELGQVVGTVQYMSPEQAELNQLDIDTRSDIYSLGVMLYELLTGSKPLDGDSIRQQTILQVLETIRSKDPPRPSVRLSSVSQEAASDISDQRRIEVSKLKNILRGELDWIVMKALEKDRTRRYESASGFAADIRRYLNHEPVLARPPSLGYRMQKFVRKNRAAVMAGSVVAVALVIGLGVALLGLGRALRAEKLAQQRLVEALDAKQKESEQRELAEQRQKEAEAEKERAEVEKSRAEAAVVQERIARAREERERKFAQAVTQFVKEDFLALTSVEGQHRFGGEGLDRDTTVYELLERAAEKLQARSDLAPLVEAELCWIIGVNFRGAGEAAKGIPFLKRAVELRTAELGSDHAETLDSMNSLAVGYRAAGQPDKALPLLGQTLELMKSKLGNDHPYTLATMGNLAGCYSDAGQLDKALPLLEQTLELMKTSLGHDHPQTLQSMNNLALGYRAAGRLDRALPLHERTLELMKSKLGPDHPDTLTCMSNLAMGYSAAGRLDRALPLYEQSLELMKSKLGSDHPDTLTSMNNLALGYRSAGRLDKALPLYEQALELMKSKLGPDHPLALTTMGNLAAGYEVVGRLDKALPLYEQTLELMRGKLGPDHPDTLISMNNLASGYDAAGQLDKALPLHEQTLELRKSKLGPDHPDTLISMNNLALVYDAAGQLDKALPLYEQTLELRKSKLGPDHPDTLQSMGNLAAGYWSARRLDLSVPLFERVLELQVRKLGRSHPDTQMTVANLGVNYKDAGQVEQAIPLLEEACESSKQMPQLGGVKGKLRDAYFKGKRIEQWRALAELEVEEARRTLPKDSPELADVLVLIGTEYLAVGEAARAEELLTESLQIHQRFAPEAWNTFNAQSLLGGAFLAQALAQTDEAKQAGLVALAQPLLTEGYEGMKQRESSIPPQAASAIPEALDRLIELHKLLDQPELAARYQELRNAHSKKSAGEER